jgi:uncharacterized protein YbjT (DUF2867 family)
VSTSSNPTPATPSSSAFVAGATGYTGREVVAALRALGVPTVAHVRPDSATAATWRARFTALGARVDESPWDAATLRASIATHRPTHVFALLGTTRKRAAREGLTDAYERVDYGLSAMLLDACRHAGHAPRFVYLSAIGVREDTANAYLRVRARLERELQESGLPYLIARPAFITGSDREESRPAERVASIVVDGLLGAASLLGARALRDRYASLTGRALAQGITVLALASRDGRAEADVAAIRAAHRTFTPASV